MKKIYLKEIVNETTFMFEIYEFSYWIVGLFPYDQNESYFIIDTVFGYNKTWALPNTIVRKYYICG